MTGFVVFLVILVSCCIVCCGVKPHCKHNSHIAGEWKEQTPSTQTKKSFYCCGWDNNDFMSNTTLCGNTTGRSVDPFQGSNVFLTQSGDRACSCDINGNSRLSVSKRESFEWIPEHCDLLPWNAIHFCKLLGNRTIFLIGDSTMVQTAATLMSMITYNGGLCADQIMMGRSNELFFSLHGARDLFSSVAFYKPSICVMNAGAHFHDMGDMYSIWENIKKRVKELKSSSKRTTFVWKTQNPAHISTQYSEPVKQYIPIDESVDRYAYRLYPSFDALAYNYSAELGFKVLDMSPLYLRPDAHSDNMHYCLPGPIDLFSVLLLNMLHNGEL